MYIIHMLRMPVLLIAALFILPTMAFAGEPQPATPALPHTSTTTSSSTPSATPAVPSINSDGTDSFAPIITTLEISPTIANGGDSIDFVVSAYDRSGIGNVIFDIVYPADASHDGYVLRPNCNFFGDKRGTCSFSESIDHGIFPTITGAYVIASVRISDLRGNVATYYPDGTIDGSRKKAHNFIIPSILIQ